MKNAEMTEDGHTLNRMVDLAKEVGPRSTGKTIIMGSTEGNVAMPDREEVKVGRKVYWKK